MRGNVKSVSIGRVGGGHLTGTRIVSKVQFSIQTRAIKTSTGHAPRAHDFFTVLPNASFAAAARLGAATSNAAERIALEAEADALEAEYQAVLTRAAAAEAHTVASAATYWWPVGSFGSGFQCRKVHRPCEIGDLLHNPELYSQGSFLTKRARDYLREARAAQQAAKAARKKRR